MSLLNNNKQLWWKCILFAKYVYIRTKLCIYLKLQNKLKGEELEE